MIKFVWVKATTATFFILILFASFLTFQGCIKKRSQIADTLFKKTHNPVFKDVTPEGFSIAFKKVFAKEKGKLSHPNFILNFYERNHFEPIFTLGHLYNNDLENATGYLMKSSEHGLSPEMFGADELKAAIENFHRKNGIKTLDDAYADMAELEINAANSLINYTNTLQYGAFNPRYVYQRYYVATKRPDSISMSAVFHIDNMQNYLDNLQPKDPQYVALQKALKNNFQGAGISGEETKRMLLVNLERLRWRNKPFEDRYVVVNIPDYMLNVVDSGHSVSKMKVCVGEGRNVDNANTLEAYNDTCKDDKPGDHETPLLNSWIYEVEVNPVWNIPRSIANKEIIVEAAKDKFYLGNSNIDVYKDGKQVDNPENIDWTNITKDNLPYEFKQESGSDNSLGLIKFIFKNKSNIYLHDTPVKSAFYRKMRSISHGCVRLDDAKGLALTLFGQGDQFQQISDVMGNDDPNPTIIYLPKKVPVYITYNTCWADENGILQFRKDVYGLDIVLYDHLAKLLHPSMN